MAIQFEIILQIFGILSVMLGTILQFDCESLGQLGPDFQNLHCCNSLGKFGPDFPALVDYESCPCRLRLQNQTRASRLHQPAEQSLSRLSDCLSGNLPENTHFSVLASFDQDAGSHFREPECNRADLYIRTEEPASLHSH